jgi:hypothetical protein
VLLARSLFDKDGNGVLDYKETLGLAAALQQISKLFYGIRNCCQDDTNYVPSFQVVAELQQRGEPLAHRAQPPSMLVVDMIMIGVTTCSSPPYQLQFLEDQKRVLELLAWCTCGRDVLLAFNAVPAPQTWG